MPNTTPNTNPEMLKCRWCDHAPFLSLTGKFGHERNYHLPQLNAARAAEGKQPLPATAVKQHRTRRTVTISKPNGKANGVHHAHNTQQAIRETPTYEQQLDRDTHYAAGYVRCWLELYALSGGLSPEPFAAGVSALLGAHQGGSILGLPKQVQSLSRKAA